MTIATPYNNPYHHNPHKTPIVKYISLSLIQIGQVISGEVVVLEGGSVVLLLKQWGRTTQECLSHYTPYRLITTHSFSTGEILSHCLERSLVSRLVVVVVVVLQQVSRFFALASFNPTTSFIPHCTAFNTRYSHPLVANYGNYAIHSLQVITFILFPQFRWSCAVTGEGGDWKKS